MSNEYLDYMGNYFITNQIASKYRITFDEFITQVQNGDFKTND